MFYTFTDLNKCKCMEKDLQSKLQNNAIVWSYVTVYM